VARPDKATKELQEAADLWRDIHGKNDAEVFSLLREDDIDILIELAGHTGGNRLPLLAGKPVPVQATYIGYPGTTGLTAIDYCITDSIIAPADISQKWYTEKLCNLHGPFFSYSPPVQAPSIGPLPVQENGYITFGVFHNLTKVPDEVVHLWSQILQKLPESKILWQAKAFAEMETRDRTLERFAQYDVSASRITLHAATNLEEHLELHNSVDISLDTYPWTGHTTTCHSLWMGVPIITMAGENHRSRLGKTTLVHAGLPELVSSDASDYVTKNIQLAKDVQRLSRYRANLRRQLQASQIMDYRNFVANLENMYDSWCE
jgi:predicted O-linked N-acetylglucosamine transferase (SPINDLY family)